MSGDKVRQLLDVIGRQNVAIEKLIAERDELRQHLENLAPGAPDAHACLRRIYNDPEAPRSERGKAASSAIGYEKAKPAQTVNNVFSLANYLDQQAQLRKEAAKTIEHAPAQPTTVLGEGQGQHGAWHQDHDDPAA
jgi:hypothetical protein